jgi:HEPN domain-containing protein
MENKNFDPEKMIKYWVDSSDEDFETMNAMFESKRYSWSMFVGHLMIEKLLKALYVKTNNDFPPYLHNLLRLAEMCDLNIDEEQRLFFATVTAFNINARYDDYKMTFQKTCTPDFSSLWILRLQNQRQWIKELLQQ